MILIVVAFFEFSLYFSVKLDKITGLFDGVKRDAAFYINVTGHLLLNCLLYIMAYSFDPNVDMNQLLESGADIKIYEPGEVVKGIVVGMFKKDILVDLHDHKVTGVIKGKEAAGIFKEVEVGQEVMAIVMDDENEDGELMLSFRKAGQLRAWDKFYEAYENQELVEVMPTAANKGGLLVDVSGIKAFLPVSQLAPENYPRVDDSNATKILEKLQALVAKKFQVRVIGIDKELGKLIFSEREARVAQRKNALKDLAVGTVVKGRVTGIVKFGIFVAFQELEGLVHISEIAWGHVKNPADFSKVGDEVDIKVIGIDGEKISLSMKQLQKDPWMAAVEEFTKGKVVKGTINKVSDFGAFVTLNSDVKGLIHLSEIDHDLVTDPKEYFKEGESVEAKVIDIDLKERRIALSVKALKPAPEKKEEKKEEKTV